MNTVEFYVVVITPCDLQAENKLVTPLIIQKLSGTVFFSREKYLADISLRSRAACSNKFTLVSTLYAARVLGKMLLLGGAHQRGDIVRKKRTKKSRRKLGKAYFAQSDTVS